MNKFMYEMLNDTYDTCDMYDTFLETKSLLNTF